MTRTPPQSQWLAVIRYQLLAAIEQSLQPGPLATLAINGLQDAVEAMLGLAIEHRSLVTKGKDSFTQQLDLVLADVPDLSAHRSRMLALNVARVAFKHHGNFLNRMTIDRHRASADAFLEDAAISALATPLGTVTMVEFVADAPARREIEAADQAWQEGDGQQALARLRLAFDRVVQDYENRKVWVEGISLFDLRPRPWPHRRHDEDRRVGRLEEWLKGLDRRTKLLTFGVDMTRYTYLDAHAPAVHWKTDGRALLGIAPGGPPITDEVYRRCQRFVIDTALHLTDRDYEFDASPPRPAEVPEERIIDVADDLWA